MEESNSFTKKSYTTMSLEEVLFLEYFKIVGRDNISLSYSITTSNNLEFKKNININIAKEMGVTEMHKLIFLDTPKDLLREILEGGCVFVADGLVGESNLGSICVNSSSVISVFPLVPKLDFYKWDKLSDKLKMKVMNKSPMKDFRIEDVIGYLPTYIQLIGSCLTTLEKSMKDIYIRVTIDTVKRLLDSKGGKLSNYFIASLNTAIGELDNKELKNSLLHVVEGTEYFGEGVIVSMS